ncbi:MAG: YraN family protein [Eggerthellaceae bacterium]
MPYTVFGAIPESDGGPGPDSPSAADPPSFREKRDCGGDSESGAAPSCPSCGEGQPELRNTCSSGHNKDLGRRGEQAAARFLERRGMEILERNWVCSAGEADIIAHDGEAIHFVEVKTRSNIAHGFPSEAVTPEKRSRYERIAAIYLSRSEYVDVSVLFDIISIVVTGPNRAFLRFHRNAFASCD